MIVALLVGYFLGREHVKYELRTTLADGGRAFADGMQKSFADAFGGVNSGGPEPVKEFSYGQPFDAPGIQVSIVDARIAHPELIDHDGKSISGPHMALIYTLRVKNTDDRKVVVYDRLIGGPCLFRDDVGNQVRPIDQPRKIKGQLLSDDEILPGMEVKDVGTSQVPLPKTKHLVITLRLKAFGEEGEALCKLPVEQIKDFRQ